MADAPIRADRRSDHVAGALHWLRTHRATLRGGGHAGQVHSKRFLVLRSTLLLIVCLSLGSPGCNGTTHSSRDGTGESASNAGAATPKEPEPPGVHSTPGRFEQLSAFVRRIFQDQAGNLWFGTNGDGVIRYDGDALEYFSIDEGFGGAAVRGIVQDREGHVWFGTERGLTRYDGASFTNYTEQDGLVSNDVWSLVLDSKGLMWIGTLQGVSRFDGAQFTPFALPESEPDPTRGVTSSRIVHCIMEDSRGQMWFATNGGAYIYDGTSLTSISEQDGLCHNAVNCILEDKDGDIWFATHHNGVCRFDGTSFTHFTSEDGVTGTEAWDLYEDRSGNIWFPIENSGVYRFDGTSFTNFQEEQGLTSNAIQCTFEDREGRLWLGGWMGLFRYDGKSIIRVGRNGPWR
jgi:ligand-binding sensor domain-containing protein